MTAIQPTTLQSSQAGITAASPTQVRHVSVARLCQLDPGTVTHQQRLPLMLDLRAALAEQPQALSRSQAGRLAALAHYLCDWPGLKLLQQHGYQPVDPIEQLLPDIQLGRYAEACAALHNCNSSVARSKRLQAMKSGLQQAIQQQPYPAEALSQGAISLTLLQCHHVGDFGWQYGSSDIARLCNLPVFQSAEHWLAWLYQCKLERSRLLFAVIHKDFGLIGSVSLQLFHGVGFFYYWLGKDFQGQGFGPVAVDLLLQLGQRYLGMHCCFAKVFSFNLPSKKAILRIGFTHLPFTARAPSEHEEFYYLGPAQHLFWLHHQLQDLLSLLLSGIELEPLS
ncbi:GNAT family N-acetyltransferase [Rheinheimera marina]|uniref:GNAT family N-acetyltransferase n=1 Tax=Rheinheimera marina TaxID=1774958 RepID=A0ABV9JPP8_9GAMM